MYKKYNNLRVLSDVHDFYFNAVSYKFYFFIQKLNVHKFWGNQPVLNFAPIQ